MAQFCSKCGAPIKADEKFCAKCGAPTGLGTKNAVQQTSQSSASKAVLIGVAIALLVVAGGGGAYWYLTKPTEATTTAKVATSAGNKDDKAEKKDDALATVQAELQKRGISGNVIATSYGHNKDGCLVILQGAPYQLAVWDQKNDQVAYISAVRDEDNVYYFQGKRTSSILDPLIMNLTILNGYHGADDRLGKWDGATHTLPIYALYDLDDNGNVIPGRLTSGEGLRPSHYQAYLKDQKSVDISNIVLTEMRALHADAGKRNVKI